MHGYSFILAQMTGPSPEEAARPPLGAGRGPHALLAPGNAQLGPAAGVAAGLLALPAIAVIVQGPSETLGQFFDVPGHLRLLSAALARLRNAGRAVALLVGTIVLTWTLAQFPHYNEEARLNDLVVLTRSMSIGELAFGEGVLAALTPLRDICGLSDVLILLAGAPVRSSSSRLTGGATTTPIAS